MKDSLLTGDLRKDRDRSVHLIFQIAVLSQFYRNVAVYQINRVIFIQLNVIRYHIIFCKDRR